MSLEHFLINFSAFAGRLDPFRPSGFPPPRQVLLRESFLSLGPRLLGVTFVMIRSLMKITEVNSAINWRPKGIFFVFGLRRNGLRGHN